MNGEHNWQHIAQFVHRLARLYYIVLQIIP